MSALLETFQIEEHDWYHKMTSFQFQFLLHLLAHVLMELNKLNKMFQYDNVDITQIGGHLNVCIAILTWRFFSPRGLAFGRGSKFLRPSLEA